MVEQWCLAATADPAFVAAMEDVLAVDRRPNDPAQPVVGLAGTSRHLLGETRVPMPVAPGHPAAADPEYVRGGVAPLFLVTAPLRGWRHVLVGDRRIRLECASCIKELVDGHDPDAERIVPVMGPRIIQRIASLTAAFPPAEARRLAASLELHHTPKHGSWLNMAGVELSVLARQCLATRLPPEKAMRAAATAWTERRNATIPSINWQLTTADARNKLRRLSPAIGA